MLSAAQEQSLISLCDQFIIPGEEVGLPNLHDLVNSTIPDQENQEWKVWTKHMDNFNEAWQLINKDGENIAWPKVFVFLVQHDASVQN